LTAELALGPPDAQNPAYPTVLGNNLWYKDSRHAQWDAALAVVGDPGDGNRVRVAHPTPAMIPTTPRGRFTSQPVFRGILSMPIILRMPPTTAPAFSTTWAMAPAR
jgi:hypothetical protein